MSTTTTTTLVPIHCYNASCKYKQRHGYDKQRHGYDWSCVVAAIQYKGCMLIRLLFEFNLSSDSLCIGIAKAVVDALSRKKDRNVQCEVLSLDDDWSLWRSEQSCTCVYINYIHAHSGICEPPSSCVWFRNMGVACAILLAITVSPFNCERPSSLVTPLPSYACTHVSLHTIYLCAVYACSWFQLPYNILK